MPLSDGVRRIASTLEQLRQEDLVEWQSAASTVHECSVDASVRAIAAGQQGRTRGRAHRLHIVILELHTRRRERVDAAARTAAAKRATAVALAAVGSAAVKLRDDVV